MEAFSTFIIWSSFTLGIFCLFSFAYHSNRVRLWSLTTIFIICATCSACLTQFFGCYMNYDLVVGLKPSLNSTNFWCWTSSVKCPKSFHIFFKQHIGMSWRNKLFAWIYLIGIYFFWSLNFISFHVLIGCISNPLVFSSTHTTTFVPNLQVSS